jgi:RNA polymerase sigma-70 factor (ECF subfamily)
MAKEMCNAAEIHDMVRRAAAGDRAALERLLLDHYEPLVAKINHRLPSSLQNFLAADDIVQQTYAKVFRCVAEYEPRGECSFLSWLLAIAENCLRDAIRSERRKKRGGDHTQLRAAGDEQQSRDLQLVELLAGPNHTPSRSVARHEGIQALRTALAGLPDEHRQAIHLRYFSGYSIEETAVLMGRTTGAVRGLIDRARKQLRDSLGRASRYLSGR